MHRLVHEGTGEIFESDNLKTLYGIARSKLRECKRNDSTGGCQQCQYCWCDDNGKPLPLYQRHFMECESHMMVGEFPALVLDGNQVTL